LDASASVRIELSNVSLLDTAAAGPRGPPFFNAPIVLNAGPGVPAAGVQPTKLGAKTVRLVYLMKWHNNDQLKKTQDRLGTSKKGKLTTERRLLCRQPQPQPGHRAVLQGPFGEPIDALAVSIRVCLAGALRGFGTSGC